MPFASEKQKRWLYANKPEIAKRWSAEYHNEGGLSKWWNALKAHKGESDMVKQNRLSAQYQNARNAGLVPEGMKKNEWLQTQAGQEAQANTTGEAVQSVGETMELLPVLGDVRAMENAWEAIQNGDYTTAATEVGLTALGFVPFAGIAAKAGKGIRRLKHADQIKKLKTLGFTAEQADRAINNPHAMDALLGDALYSGRTTVDNLVDQGHIAKDAADGAKQSIKDLQRFEEVTGVRPNFRQDDWSAQSMNSDIRPDNPYGNDAVNLNIPAPLTPERQFIIDHELGHIQNPYGTANTATGNLAELAEEEAANRYAVNRATERGGIRPDYFDRDTTANLDHSYGSYLNNQEVLVHPEEGSTLIQRLDEYDDAGEYAGMGIYNPGRIPDESRVYDILDQNTEIATATPEGQANLLEGLSPDDQARLAETGEQFGIIRQNRELHPSMFKTGTGKYTDGEGSIDTWDVGALLGEEPPANYVEGGPRVGEYKQPAALSAKTGNWRGGRSGPQRKRGPRKSKAQIQIDRIKELNNQLNDIQWNGLSDEVKAQVPNRLRPASAQNQQVKTQPALAKPVPEGAGKQNVARGGQTGYGDYELGDKLPLETGIYADNNWQYANAAYPHNIEPGPIGGNYLPELEGNPKPLTQESVKLPEGVHIPTERVGTKPPRKRRGMSDQEFNEAKRKYENQVAYEDFLKQKFKKDLNHWEIHGFGRANIDYPDVFPLNKSGAENYKRMLKSVEEKRGIKIGSPLREGWHRGTGSPGYNASVAFIGIDGNTYDIPVSLTDYKGRGNQFNIGNTRGTSGLGSMNPNREMDLGAPRFKKGGRVCGPLAKY